METGSTLFKCANGELFNINKILTIERIEEGHYNSEKRIGSGYLWWGTLDGHERHSIDLTQQDYERLLSILSHII